MSMSSNEIRIDKFLWAVRLYKTRSMASEACRKGRISIRDIQAKPSHIVRPGEIIMVKKPPVVYTYKVIEPTASRVSAKLTVNYICDLTPEEEKNKISIARQSGTGFRPRGLGRPTKKERRTIDRFNDNLSI